MESGKLTKIELKNLPDPGNRFKIGMKIGGGVGGDVHEAVEADTVLDVAEKKVAVKIIDLKRETEMEIKQEIQVLKAMSGCENFPEFFGAFLKKGKDGAQKVWLVMELCEGGTANDLARKLIQGNRKMSEVHIAYIIRETIKAVIHLHDKEICHRDIRGRNILLTSDGKVKLIDFGISKRIDKNKKIRTFVGSPSWIAPEVITCQAEDESVGYDKKADVWAIGITAIELGDGQAPFEDIHPGRAIFQIVQNPPPTLRKPSDWSQLYNDFISECLVKVAENRPYVQELLGHTFFESVDASEDIQNEIQTILETHKDENLYNKPDIQVRKGYMKIEQQPSPEKILQEDLAALTDVSEDSVLSELYERFNKNQFYTFVGDILLVLNPNKNFDLYGEQFHKKYRFKAKSQNSPHIYSVADSAYRDAFHHEKPQHILFAGETGAGKTVNMMHAVDHLLFLGQGLKCSEKVRKSLQVIQIMGNAATPQNANSTRHVLHTQLMFTETGKVSGGVFRVYQLEKERVTTAIRKQANFNLFYCFYESLKSEENLSNYHLDSDKTYKFLKAGLDSDTNEKSDNIEQYQLFENNLTDLDFDEESIESIRSILSAILLLGEIEFVDDEEEKGMVATPEIVNSVADLLGVDKKKLSWAFVNYCVITRGEAAMGHNSKEEAEEAKNVLARGIYARLVDWIVNKINEKLLVSRLIYGDKNVISLFDFYGFECYKKNSLNQLFVNLLNEQLQFHYNQKIFSWDKHTAKEEEIPFPNIDFKDNKPLIDLLMSKPDGLLHKLDEATRSEESSDLIGSLPDSKTSPIFSETVKAFSINHYTGKLTYDVSDMPEKNKDFLPPELIDTMRLSTKAVTKHLFSTPFTRSGNLSTEPSLDGVPERKKPKETKTSPNLPGHYSQSRQMRTVAATFRGTIIDIIKTLTTNEFGCHFVRCIRTDLPSKPDEFHPEVVRQQLKALAVVNTVLTTQQGYSYNVPHDEFIRRYKFLAFDFDENVEETKENCRLLLLRLKLEGWTMGRSKVFLKYYNKEYLSRLYETQIKKIVKVQSMMRAFMARRKLFAKIKKYQVDADVIKLKKEERKESLIDDVEAAIIIQKRYRVYSARKKNKSIPISGDLDEKQKEFIRPWCKRWRAKSIFQVLLIYRAERLQTLVDFCLQIHLFNQSALSCICKINEEINLEMVNVNTNATEYLPPRKTVTFKMPIVWESFILRSDVSNQKPLPECSLEQLESEVNAIRDELTNNIQRESAKNETSLYLGGDIFVDKELQSLISEEDEVEWPDIKEIQSQLSNSRNIDEDQQNYTDTDSIIFEPQILTEKAQVNTAFAEKNITYKENYLNSLKTKSGITNNDPAVELNTNNNQEDLGLQKTTEESDRNDEFVNDNNKKDNAENRGLVEVLKKNLEIISIVKSKQNDDEDDEEQNKIGKVFPESEKTEKKIEDTKIEKQPTAENEEKSGVDVTAKDEIARNDKVSNKIVEVRSKDSGVDDIQENKKQTKDFRNHILRNRLPSLKSQEKFKTSLQELEEKFRKKKTDDDDEPPFNFRSMLRKTNIATNPQRKDSFTFRIDFAEKRNSLSSVKLRRSSETITTEIAPGIMVHGKIADL